LVVSIADRDLIDRRFWLSAEQDPEDLNNILPRVRALGADMLEFEYIYDRTPAKRKSGRLVPCAHCGRRNHFHGYVLRYPDGAGVLIGKDCGAKNYGLWFHTKQTEFSDRITRASALGKLRAASQRLPDALTELGDLLEDAGWTDRSISRATNFRNKFRKLCDHLLSATSGRLIAPVQVRDSDAENRRDARIDREIKRRAEAAGMEQEEYERRNHEVLRSDPSLEREPLHKSEEQEVARFAGQAYLKTALANARAKIAATLDELQQDSDRLRESSTDDKKTEELFAEIGRVRGHVTKMRDLLRDLGDGANFFDPANFETICRWAQMARTGEGVYRVEGKTLILEIRDGQKFPFNLVRASLPDLPALTALERAVET
jgi:hypothetical protein